MSGDGSIIGEIAVVMGPGFLLVPPLPNELTARILDPAQRRAPTSLTVTVAGGYGRGRILFYYDADIDFSYTAVADSDGNLAATSIPVAGDMMSGAHTLTVESLSVDETGSRSVVLDFTLSHNPATGHVVGPDADPVYIEDALQADGHLHWVFQDLMPDGLGSYVFPHNPVKSNRPDFERALAARRSTANDGQVHVSEGVGTLYPWTITGFCFNEDEQTELEAWADLNRRFYVIDDFGEAWTVASTGVDIKPRKRSDLQVRGEPAALTDWLAEYTFSMNVYVPDPLTPVGAP